MGINIINTVMANYLGWNGGDFKQVFIHFYYFYPRQGFYLPLRVKECKKFHCVVCVVFTPHVCFVSKTCFLMKKKDF